MDPKPVARTEAPKARTYLRGELRIAGVGFAMMAILLASMGGSAWWAVRTQWLSLCRSQAEQAATVGNTLARTSEVMLADNELSAVRRIVAETARDAGLARCRIVMPDGKVVADSSPAGITVRELPANWPGAACAGETGGDNLTRTLPLVVPGRGSASLEITAAADPLLAAAWPTQAGIGGICIGALVMLLLLHRRVRSGMRGLFAVRQALLAHESGQTAAEALEVNPDWGLEARAWNNFLNREQKRDRRVAIEKTKEVLLVQRGQTDNLAAACDALAQGLVLVGKDLRAQYVNSAAAVLLQTKRDALLSADVASFIQDPRVLAAVRATAGGSMQRRTIIEVQRSGPDGCGWLRYIVRPVRREDWGVAMIIIEDTTQQRVAEEARNAFVAQATHELRTPLTNIRLYAEMALDEGKDDPGVRSNCLNVINQETFRLDRIVGDILSIAEIEAGTLTLKKDDVRLDEIFPELKADYAAQAQDKQIRLAFNLPPKLPVIKGDRDKVRLALHNLLGNALKYTPAGGQVSVNVNVNAEDGRLVVDVSDTGIGMSEEDCQRVFEKFYRARDRRVSEIKGSGLGLTIAREVIRLHGGDITVQSELDKGSTFTLVLPLVEEPALV